MSTLDNSTHRLTPLILLLSLPFLHALSLSTFLNSSRTPTLLPPNLTATPHNMSDDQDTHCFTNAHYKRPTSAAACELSKNFVLRRDFVDPLQYQVFSCDFLPLKWWHPVPDQWTAFTGANDCRILLLARSTTGRDSFRLLDIADAAQKVIEKCLVEREGSVWAGLRSVGNHKGFYVGLDGLLPEAERGGG